MVSHSRRSMGGVLSGGLRYTLSTRHGRFFRFLRLGDPESPRGMVGTYVGRDRVLTQLPNGLPFLVRGSDTGISPHIINRGHWEPWVLRFLRDRLREFQSPVFIDIGAHFGYFPCALVGNTRLSRVIAVEANPTTYGILVDNIALAGLREVSTCINAGAWSCEARGYVKEMEGNTGGVTPDHGPRCDTRSSLEN